MNERNGVGMVAKILGVVSILAVVAVVALALTLNKERGNLRAATAEVWRVQGVCAHYQQEAMVMVFQKPMDVNDLCVGIWKR